MNGKKKTNQIRNTMPFIVTAFIKKQINSKLMMLTYTMLILMKHF